ncbi:hypothetical protein T492DRAFT_1148925 [Pavlovales sp. CCMP2436]|nr:hypothetical protein T492DRAFT_1148925 [Pavlovales sp. CCMP2436]
MSTRVVLPPGAAGGDDELMGDEMVDEPTETEAKPRKSLASKQGHEPYSAKQQISKNGPRDTSGPPPESRVKPVRETKERLAPHRAEPARRVEPARRAEPASRRAEPASRAGSGGRDLRERLGTQTTDLRRGITKSRQPLGGGITKSDRTISRGGPKVSPAARRGAQFEPRERVVNTNEANGESRADGPWKHDLFRTLR